jgi:hypothetical protein
MKPRRISSIPSLCISVIALSLISIIVFVISLSITNSWWSGFLAGLTTEIWGILLTLLSVDLILKKRDENKRRRIELIAFSQLRKALCSHIHFLAMLANDSGKDKYTRVNDVFDNEFFEKISIFDITQPSNYLSKAPWYDIIPNSFRGLDRQIDEVVAKYIVFLGVDTLKLLEELKSSIGLSIMLKLREQYEGAKGLGYDTSQPLKGGLLADLRRHTSIVLRLVEHHNALVSAGDQIDSIQVSPAQGNVIHF